MGSGGVLFFRLDAKEKIPKERIKAAFPPLLHYGEKLKGLELASLRQSPLLTLFAFVAFDAAEMRPGRFLVLPARGGFHSVYFPLVMTTPSFLREELYFRAEG